MLGRLEKFMAMAKLTIDLPEALWQELETTNQAFLLEIIEKGLRAQKIERALAQYTQGDLSFGAAANFAGVSQAELAIQARAHSIEPLMSPETLAEELQGITR